MGLSSFVNWGSGRSESRHTDNVGNQENVSGRSQKICNATEFRFSRQSDGYVFAQEHIQVEWFMAVRTTEAAL